MATRLQLLTKLPHVTHRASASFGLASSPTTPHHPSLGFLISQWSDFPETGHRETFSTSSLATPWVVLLNARLHGIETPGTKEIARHFCSRLLGQCICPAPSIEFQHQAQAQAQAHSYTLLSVRPNSKLRAVLRGREPANMFRRSTQQLSRCLRVPVRTAVRPSTRVAASVRLTPAARCPVAYRFYSTTPPSDPNGKSQEWPEGEPNKDRKPLPPGWVYLTKEELQYLKTTFNALPTMIAPSQEALIDMIKEVDETGVPMELREFIEKHKAKQLSLMDAIKAMRVLNKMMGRDMREIIERKAQSDEQIRFDSNKPGEKRKPSDRCPEQRQDQELEAKPQQQREQEQSQQEKQQRDQQQDHQGQSGTGGGRNDQGKRTPPQPPRGFDMTEILAWAGAMIIGYPIYSLLFGGDYSREITWQELRKNFLDKGLVEKLVVVGDRVRVELNHEATQSVYPDSIAAKRGFHYYFSIGSIDAFERRLDEAQKELGIPSTERIPVSYATEGMLTNLLFAFGPTLLIVGLLVFMTRRAGGGAGNSGMFGFGKSKAKMFNHDSAVKVKFSDVAGMDEAKVEIMEFVSFLRTPERFQRLGAKIPRGAILSGPPGTGKTLLAKATAGESQVPFFSVSGSEFVEMFVGVGASRVRDLFATARKNAPCIIFIDEIDAIGKSRSDGSFRGGGNDEREATLNQILTEMDGFNTMEQIVVLAGTNRPDILDQALMRPGRFDRHIHIDRPTMKGRQDIFRVHLKKIVTNEDLEYLTGRLAALTPGFAGADIANAVNEAALVGM